MDTTLLIPILVAAALGGLIGLEREFQGKPAGLRTNVLISIGAALFMMLSSRIADAFGGDPTRIAAQIITGIGFIGAGAILYSKGSVIGLTTAATIWVVSGIGMAAGSGQYELAISTTGLVIVTLLVLGRLEARFELKGGRHLYVVRIEPEKNVSQMMESIFRKAHVAPSQLLYRRENGCYSVSFSIIANPQHNRSFATLCLETEGVIEVREETE
jgi:putative Mg2+ transporter-C (MgtC) family protein